MISTSAPSASKLPTADLDLKPSQFRLAGTTFTDGQIKFRTRRYFVGSLEVFHAHSRYEGSRLVASFTTTPREVKDDVVDHLKMMPCDAAVLQNEEGDLPLRLCLDETNLKFALARN